MTFHPLIIRIFNKIGLLQFLKLNGRISINQQKILDLIQTLEYIIYRVIAKQGELLHLKKLKTIEIHTDLNSCEYLLVHRSKENKIEQVLPIA